MGRISYWTSSTHLVGKLERDLEEMKKNPMSMDPVFNFFVTAEALVDWVAPGREAGMQRHDFRKRDVMLQICCHVASRLKHRREEDCRHRYVTDIYVDGCVFNEVFADVFGNVFGGKMTIGLDAEAKAQLGDSVPATELAEKILEFWKAEQADGTLT